MSAKLKNVKTTSLNSSYEELAERIENVTGRNVSDDAIILAAGSTQVLTITDDTGRSRSAVGEVSAAGTKVRWFAATAEDIGQVIPLSLKSGGSGKCDASRSQYVTDGTPSLSVKFGGKVIDLDSADAIGGIPGDYTADVEMYTIDTGGTVHRADATIRVYARKRTDWSTETVTFAMGEALVSRGQFKPNRASRKVLDQYGALNTADQKLAREYAQASGATLTGERSATVAYPNGAGRQVWYVTVSGALKKYTSEAPTATVVDGADCLD